MNLYWKGNGCLDIKKVAITATHYKFDPTGSLVSWYTYQLWHTTQRYATVALSMLSNTSSLLEQQIIFPQDAIFQIYYVTKDNTEDNNSVWTSMKDHKSLQWFPIVHNVTIRWLHFTHMYAMRTRHSSCRRLCHPPSQEPGYEYIPEATEHLWNWSCSIN